MSLKTTETINGKQVEITWEFKEIVDRHDSNWCVWYVIGNDIFGAEYGAIIQADGSNPEDSYDVITDIEKS